MAAEAVRAQRRLLVAVPSGPVPTDGPAGVLRHRRRVRVTIEPWGDVEVPEGARLGELRPALADLTGLRALRTSRVTVGGRPLPDDHLCGTPPLVTGARLRVGGPEDRATSPRSATDLARAAAAEWHLAVVGGRDRGRVVVPGADGTAVLAAAGAGAGSATLRRGRRARWQLAGVRGRQVRGYRPSGRRRRTALRAGDRLRFGQVTLEIRAPDPAPAGGQRAEVPPRRPSPLPSTALLAPAVAGVVLAVAMRSPVFLVLALSGPLTLLVPRVRDALRRRVEPTRPLAPDAAAQAVALRRGVTLGELEDLRWWQLAGAGGLAVVGDRAAVTGVVRALLLAALARAPLDLRLLHRREHDEVWAWCRWVSPPVRVARREDEVAPVLRPGDGPLPRLLVVDDASSWLGPTHRWWLDGRTAGEVALLTARSPDEVPGWCRWVLRHEQGRWVLTGPEPAQDVDAPWAATWWAEEQARAVAGTQRGGTRPGSGEGHPGTGGGRPAVGGAVLDAIAAIPERAQSSGIPARVPLADLVPDDPRTLVRRWALPGRAATLVGVGEHGGVEVDLVRDGPHVLVAGTTGAGKSELLQSLVLGLATARPPDQLAVVLVDFKGGAGFGRCRDLPHVVGTVTDLGRGEAARALAGIRAELRRREQLLAAAGVADLEVLRARGGGAPPRLVVVVDEFRALTEDLPDAVTDLVRVAAQGRSLGIHLVLATQRPAGAVTHELRANLAVRVCLRVTDPTDSTDVVDVPDAASIPTDRPGRAVLRRGAEPPVLLQTPWAACPPSGRGAPTVRRAEPWAAAGPGVTAPDVAHRGAADPGTAGAAVEDHTAVLVAMVDEAARQAGLGTAEAPWLPPLPERTVPADLDALTERAGRGITLAVSDLPETRGRGEVAWEPSSGALLVAGGPGSGRTTALRTLLLGALVRGHHVHVLHGRPSEAASGDGPLDLPADWHHPGLGTVVGPDDPRRMTRLLTLLLGRRGGGDVLLVDDLGSALRTLDEMPRTSGHDLVDRLLREAPAVGVVLAGLPGDLVRWTRFAGARLVLPVADPHDAGLLGVPRGLSGWAVPGRAVHLGGPDPVLCQVLDLTAEDAAAGVPPPGADGPPPTGAGTGSAQAGRAGGGPLRLAPVPLRVRLTRPACDAGGPDPGTVPVGAGGDDGGPVLVDVRAGVLVVGPHGSGRSTALEVLGMGLAARGRQVLRLDHDVVPRLRALASGSAGGGGPERTAPVVLLDDLELLLRAEPDLDGLLTTWVDGAPGAGRSTPVVVAATLTDVAATAFRGAVAALRGRAPVLLLDPVAPGSREVAGSDVVHAVDPRHRGHPGRGVLLTRGRPTPLQVADPSAG